MQVTQRSILNKGLLLCGPTRNIEEEKFSFLAALVTLNFSFVTHSPRSPVYEILIQFLPLILGYLLFSIRVFKKL